jgi:hypothetical protein
MTETDSPSDMGVGIALLFGAVTLLGAGTMYLAAADQPIAGGGFALAVLAGSVAIAAIHLYE